MKNGHPNLENALRVAIRAKVMFSDQDYEELKEWIEVDKAAKELEESMIL